MHIDSFTDFADVRLVTWDGQVFRFEFSHRFGPMMIDKRGRTIDTAPPLKSPFWKALTAWSQQGCRLDDHGCAVYDLPPVRQYVRLCGRQWALVPEGREPLDVRREWFAKAKLPMPDDRIETEELSE